MEFVATHHLPVRAARRRRMNLATKASLQPGKLAHDLLRGADQIADFLFDDAGQRRKVYHLAETSRLPVFRLGSKLCARRSVLMAWIASQEERGWQSKAIAKSQDADGPTTAKHPDDRAPSALRPGDEKGLNSRP
jgi:hypothetical protein